MTLVLNAGTIRVGWDSEELSGIVPRLYVPWQLAAGRKVPGEVEQVSIDIYRTSEGYRIETPAISPVDCRSMPELLLTLELLLTDTARDLLSAFMLLHAAVVDYGGKGVIIGGDHGTGKSTFAITAVSSGFQALSDEVGVIMEDCRTVAGFPRPFRIKRGSLGLSPPVIPEYCTPYPVTDDLNYVFVESFYKPETTLSAIVFPVRRPGETEIREVGEIESLRRLYPLGFNFYLSGDGRTADLLRLMHPLTVVEIAYSDHWDAVARLMRLLDEINDAAPVRSETRTPPLERM